MSQAPRPSPGGSMKLLTHNMLACHIKGVKENQPFIIEVCAVLSPRRARSPTHPTPQNP